MNAPANDRMQPAGREDVARLEFILANRWLSRLNGVAAGPVTARWVMPDRIAIGPVLSSAGGIPRAARADRGNGAPPFELRLSYDFYKVEDYVLFRPLAYFAAFGRDEIFQCAHLAILSLFWFGQWDGDVLVITDDAHRSFADRFPPGIRERVHVACMTARDVLDFTLARYRIVDFEIARSYQPIIYLDTDVICDAPVHQLARAAALSSQVQAAAELPFDNPLDFYGLALLKADGIDVEPDRPGFSSGIFTFRNSNEAGDLFRTIIDSAYGFAKLMGRRDVFNCYDQPFFNYVLHKTSALDGTLLKDAVTLHPSYQPFLTAPARRGFVHFAGIVGNTTPKLALMTAYFDLLRREQAAGARPFSP